MEGLLRRLSSNESEAESALRVIAFFDRLTDTRASIDELVCSSARLVGAPGGFFTTDHSVDRAFDSRGRPLGKSLTATALRKPVTSDGIGVGEVWLERGRDVSALDELVVERMALAAETIFRRGSAIPLSQGRSPLLTLLDSDKPFDIRAKCLQEVGFRREWNVRILLAKSEDPKADFDQAIRGWTRSSGVRSVATQTDELFFVAMLEDRGGLATDTVPEWPFLSALGSRTVATDAARSFENARAAIRLTSETLGPRTINYEKLGPLSLLLELSSDQASSAQLVRQITFLSQSEAGNAELLALDAFCRFRSLRTAAVELNLHHSSLAHRLKNVETKLQVNLSDPTTVFLLSIALQFFRISRWP
jgi:DNA-binding PucR family transcriptional regulator